MSVAKPRVSWSDCLAAEPARHPWVSWSEKKISKPLFPRHGEIDPSNVLILPHGAIREPGGRTDTHFGTRRCANTSLPQPAASLWTPSLPPFERPAKRGRRAARSNKQTSQFLEETRASLSLSLRLRCFKKWWVLLRQVQELDHMARADIARWHKACMGRFNHGVVGGIPGPSDECMLRVRQVDRDTDWDTPDRIFFGKLRCGNLRNPKTRTPGLPEKTRIKPNPRMSLGEQAVWQTNPRQVSYAWCTVCAVGGVLWASARQGA